MHSGDDVSDDRTHAGETSTRIPTAAGELAEGAASVWWQLLFRGYLASMVRNSWIPGGGAEGGRNRGTAGARVIPRLVSRGR
jgi:hypothetical protein